MTVRGTTDQPSVMVLGAGPNGLAAAAFLCAVGSKVQIFGRPLDTWKEKMPKGMILRSTRVSSSIASPGDAFSIDQFERQTNTNVDFSPTLSQFVAYGQWFQENCVPGVDETRVKIIRPSSDGFITELVDGRVIKTQTVVLAPGINLFPYTPKEFTGLPKNLVSHSSDHRDLGIFKDKKVVVIGKGQSALESAALLHESGAQVEIVTRGAQIKFLPRKERNVLKRRFFSPHTFNAFLYPPTDLGRIPYNWAIADPALYRGLSKKEQARLFEFIGPVGSSDLEDRLAGVTVTPRAHVAQATEMEQKIRLRLSDGSSREVDHVFLATGFLPDINALEFLSEDLKAAIAQEYGYPKLTLGYESTSVPGLYVIGALSCLSQGPINRFVCGTYPVGQYLTEAITGSKIGYPDLRASQYVAGRRLMYRMYRLVG